MDCLTVWQCGMIEAPVWPGIVTAVASAVTAAIVAVAGFFAWRQLKGLQRQTGLSAFAGIYERFESVELGEARRLIFARRHGTETLVNDQYLPADLYEAVMRVLAMYNGIGFMIYKGILPMDRPLAEYLGPPAIRMWGKLEKFVHGERARRKETTFANFFEQLAKGCQEQLPEYKLTYF